MAGFLLKASIWATLALCTGGALRSIGEQCGTLCESIKAKISSSEACAKSRKSLPRPKIGRVCQEGFDEAFTLTCGELCSLHGISRTIPNHLSEACDKRKREVPRPVAHKACVDGFNAGLASTTVLITQRIELMEEASRKSLIESNVSMLKAADAERDTLDEVRRGREAEREQKRKEEQERARKAVEEKSAQVKREKEALSKKQELETAQSAEEAQREKRKVEEGRQARIKATANAKEATKYEKLDNSVRGALEPFAPTTLGKQAEHSEDDRAAASHGPLTSKASEDLEDDRRAGAGTETDGVPSEEVHTLERIGTLDAGAPAELVQVVPVPAGEEKGGDMEDSDASRFMEIPEERQHQEMPMVERVQVSQPLTPDNDKTSKLSARDEALLAQVAENEPYARSEDSLAIEPPNELLAMEHAEGIEALLTRPDEGRPLDMLDGIEESENGQDAGPENEAIIMLPNNHRYREVLMAEHVEGFEASLARRNGGPPRETLDGLVAATERGPDPDPED